MKRIVISTVSALLAIGIAAPSMAATAATEPPTFWCIVEKEGPNSKPQAICTPMIYLDNPERTVEELDDWALYQVDRPLRTLDYLTDPR